MFYLEMPPLLLSEELTLFAVHWEGWRIPSLKLKHPPEIPVDCVTWKLQVIQDSSQAVDVTGFPSSRFLHKQKETKLPRWTRRLTEENTQYLPAYLQRSLLRAVGNRSRSRLRSREPSGSIPCYREELGSVSRTEALLNQKSL